MAQCGSFQTLVTRYSELLRQERVSLFRSYGFVTWTVPYYADVKQSVLEIKSNIFLFFVFLFMVVANFYANWYRSVSGDIITFYNLKVNIKVFILNRHDRWHIYICLQFYSLIACFVWKPEHFEFQSYGGAWHKATIAFVEKCILISWFVAFLEDRALGKVLYCIYSENLS